MTRREMIQFLAGAGFAGATPLLPAPAAPVQSQKLTLQRAFDDHTQTFGHLRRLAEIPSIRKDIDAMKELLMGSAWIAWYPYLHEVQQRQLLEDMLVIDAASLMIDHSQPTLQFHVLDGACITHIVDPEKLKTVAYQYKTIETNWVLQRNQLIYWPRNRVGNFYGVSPIEQIKIDHVNLQFVSDMIYDKALIESCRNWITTLGLLMRLEQTMEDIRRMHPVVDYEIIWPKQKRNPNPKSVLKRRIPKNQSLSKLAVPTSFVIIVESMTFVIQ